MSLGAGLATGTQRRTSMLGSASMIRLFLSRRIGNLVGFLVCAGMLAFGYYLQFVAGLEPCPLCIIQRILLLAVGVAFLAAALHHPAGRLGAGLYGGGIAFISARRHPGAGRPRGGQHPPPRKRPPRRPPPPLLPSA